jgi:membrane protease YdiL (CAAX protease family)
MQSNFNKKSNKKGKKSTTNAIIKNKSPGTSSKLFIQAKQSNILKYFFYACTIITLIVTILSIDLFANGVLSMVDAEVYSSIAFSLFLPSIVFAYLARKHNFSQILNELGLSKNHISVKFFVYGILLFLIILMLEIGLSLFSYITGIPLPTNVGKILSGMPLYFLIFSVFIAPLNEEIAFRGFLVNRIGIVASALIFAILHAGYSSIAEGLGAFIFGLLAGYVFKKTKSLYPSLIAHIIVNLLAVIVLFVLMGII